MKTFNSTIDNAKAAGLKVNYIMKGYYSVDYMNHRYSVTKNLDGWYISDSTGWIADYQTKVDCIEHIAAGRG